MSANPYQRIEYSLEFLETLRIKVRQVYFEIRKDVLQTPRNKNSPYYFYLRELIFRETKVEISEGTLMKFFCDDVKRHYQLKVIDTLQKFSTVMSKDKNKYLPPPHSSKKLIDDNLDFSEHLQVANTIYIELTTRKAALPIDFENDVIEEIYDSWFRLFKIIRDEIKGLPLYYFDEKLAPSQIVPLSNKILNNVLRPHLTEHQARFRKWIESAKNDSKMSRFTPQELQKRYPNYENLVSSMKEVNEKLSMISKELLLS